MIVKFFNRGKGGGNGPVDYLLGKDRERELAKLDQGDPDEIINLINSCEFTQKYKSGCLSFEEGDLPQVHKDKIMADFEKVLLPGLDKNQYSILWVEHKDKDRLELNFVVPCVELTTGKRLQPYYHKIDEKRVDTWKRCVNTALNLHDPDAPKNKRSSMDLNVTNLPPEKKQQVGHISKALLNQIEIGLIKNKSDIVRTLENAGFTITRQAKNTISIKDPNGGKNIKLKGEIYEQSFQFSREHASRVATAQEDYEARKPTELERNKADLARLCSAKSERNKQLYQVDKREPEQARNMLQGIVQRARERSEETHRLSDRLSHIQDAEIQRGHSLNDAGIHRRDGGSSLLDREHGERQRPEDNPAKQSAEIGRSGDADHRGKNLHNSPLQRSEESIRKPRQNSSSVGAKLNDRARKDTIERIGEIIGRSGNNVSRVQKFFRTVGAATAGATKVLRDFTRRKQQSDSVSRGLKESFGDFDTALNRVVRAVETQRKQERKQSFDSGMTPRF